MNSERWVDIRSTVGKPGIVMLYHAWNVGSYSISSLNRRGLVPKASASKGNRVLLEHHFVEPMADPKTRGATQPIFFKPTEEGKSLILKYIGGIRTIPLDLKDGEDVLAFDKLEKKVITRSSRQ